MLDLYRFLLQEAQEWFLVLLWFWAPRVETMTLKVWK